MNACSGAIEGRDDNTPRPDSASVPVAEHAGSEPRPSPLRLISYRETSQIAGLSVSTIYRLQKADRFPKAVSISERRRALVLQEVNLWVEEHMSRRPGYSSTASLTCSD
jgi:predicted DNA-binding transcriptional regulator AlpA